MSMQTDLLEPTVPDLAANAPAAESTRRHHGLKLPYWARAVLNSKKATAGVLIAVLFAAVALLAPVIAPGDPSDFVARPHQAPSAEHWFGTTGQGQDVFAQTVWGSRSTLAVGLLVGLLTTVIGVLVGVGSGYFGGAVDESFSLIVNIFLIVPSLPLLVVLSAFIGSGTPWFMILVLTITGWAWPARVMRSQAISLREKDFVAAAQVSGEGGMRIVLSEILPNMFSIVVASFLGSGIYAIGAQAALEFLGLGNPSVVSWGTNLYWAGNNAGLLTGAWWTFVPAGLCIALIAFAFVLMNYAIDEVTNPRLRARGAAVALLKRPGFRLTAGRATPVLRPTGGD
ncbi:MAG: ABC transporter permease [Chloroflexota bacterium]|nr:ABC transporter permease [Chloroflexota bacterium]